MKYTEEIIINSPIDQVINAFDNEQNLFKWMEELKSLDLIKGPAGEPGAKSKMVMIISGRNTEMIETVLSKNLPDEYTALYEMPKIQNIISNKFNELQDGKTLYSVETEFKFEQLILKIISSLFPSIFKKQTQKNLRDFKKFVESL